MTKNLQNEKLQEILDALTAMAWYTVRRAKSMCGQFNEYVDCEAYLSRDRLCPECPHNIVEDLEDELKRLGLEDEEDGHY